MRSVVLAACVASLLGLVGCAEKAQTNAGPKPDAKAWDAPQSGFVNKDWKAGDKASWEEQMRNRAQGQNEYVRGAAVPQ